jgi:hypothetical protein
VRRRITNRDPYSGASVTGNTALQVPSPADGVIAVRPGVIADKVFVAIQ